MDNFNTLAVNKKATINSIVNAYARPKTTDKEKILFIKIILFKTMLLSCMYEMRQTNQYQKGVKKSGNEYIRELNKNLFEYEYTNLLSTDAPAIEEMEKGMEEFAEEVCKATLGCFAVLSETIKKYNECPDFVLDRLNIIKGESEQIAELTEREDLIKDILLLPMKGIRQLKPTVHGLKNIHITN